MSSKQGAVQCDSLFGVSRCIIVSSFIPSGLVKKRIAEPFGQLLCTFLPGLEAEPCFHDPPPPLNAKSRAAGFIPVVRLL